MAAHNRGLENHKQEIEIYMGIGLATGLSRHQLPFIKQEHMGGGGTGPEHYCLECAMGSSLALKCSYSLTSDAPVLTKKR